MKKLLLSIVIIFLAGCYAKPKIVQIENGNEYSFNCNQLHMEMENAKQAKIDAHAEDKFRFRYMVPITGIMSVVNIWRADSHATNRLKLLNEIALQKGCFGNPYGNYNQQNRPVQQMQRRY